MRKNARLYLIPTALSPDDKPHEILYAILPQIEVFICERIRTTRRWLRSVIPDFNIDGCIFLEYDKHTDLYPWQDISKAWQENRICGLTSEAGTPAVADPGFQVVRSAHIHDVPVVALPGNNSLILAMMSSGFDGNRFTYHGYFPVDSRTLHQTLKSAIGKAAGGYAQIFIETPYRNISTLQKIFSVCPEDIALSISCNLLSEQQRSVTKTLKEWKKESLEYLHKAPAVFVFGKW